jgi:hypothetical protein
VRGQRHGPAAPYIRGKTRYPVYRWPGGPQGRFGQVRKISPPPGFDPRTVQPVCSRYTDYATRPTLHIDNNKFKYLIITCPIMHPIFLQPDKMTHFTFVSLMKKKNNGKHNTTSRRFLQNKTQECQPNHSTTIFGFVESKTCTV